MKRYATLIDKDCKHGCRITETPTGEYVWYEDHYKIVGKLNAKIAKLEEEVSNLGWQVSPERMGR